MSGNGYGYYYPPNTSNFGMQDTNQSWTKWSLEQQQYNESYGRNTGQHHNQLNLSNNHTNTFGTPPPPPPPSLPQQNRTQNFFNSTNNRHYPQRRYNNVNQSFQSQQNWQHRNNHNKRPRPQELSSDNLEPKSKSGKKKKKPLSQNIPSKKDWTMEEAEMALAVEKEYNKRYKNHSLIIKFPDLELNRDIVSKFHPSIENVHFQQPSTPRFCFVTLKETADADTVIESLNKIKFGEGHLTAEYKKDREEDQNIGPEDIDPCTLYVGNLAQEITKVDMVKTYPKGRRIDIGYAKKMKYTRYAFVSFKNVSDSIEAFKKTHSTQMYSKSLIVRFRRLHGTVGMPGETKAQSPAKNRTDSINSINEISPESVEQELNSTVGNNSNTNHHNDFDLSVVKQEVNTSDEDEFESPFLPDNIDLALQKHKPIKMEIKQEIINNDGDNYGLNSIKTSSVAPIKDVVKRESDMIKHEKIDEGDSSDDDDIGDNIGDVNFSSLLNQLEDHSNQIQSLRKLVP